MGKLQDDQHIIFVNNSNENKSFKEENVTQKETIKELQSSITFVENKVKEKEEKLVKSVTALSASSKEMKRHEGEMHKLGNELEEQKVAHFDEITALQTVIDEQECEIQKMKQDQQIVVVNNEENVSPKQ